MVRVTNGIERDGEISKEIEGQRMMAHSAGGRSWKELEGAGKNWKSRAAARRRGTVRECRGKPRCREQRVVTIEVFNIHLEETLTHVTRFREPHNSTSRSSF